VTLRTEDEHLEEEEDLSSSPQHQAEAVSSLSPTLQQQQDTLPSLSLRPLTKIEEKLRCTPTQESRGTKMQVSPWAAYNKSFASQLGDVPPAKAGGQMGEVLAKPGGQLGEAGNGGQPNNIPVQVKVQPAQKRRRGNLPTIITVKTKK
jgi:hypothetical protein